jgi:hypothetical protein
MALNRWKRKGASRTRRSQRSTASKEPDFPRRKVEVLDMASSDAFESLEANAFEYEIFSDPITGLPFIIRTNLETGERTKFIQPSAHFSTALDPVLRCNKH